jgi:hypothetical protein
VIVDPHTTALEAMCGVPVDAQRGTCARPRRRR